MRPTGRLHLGHLYGVIHNWVKLQHEYECYFFVADWHALTTHYETPHIIENNVWEMVIDWLAAGVSPSAATLFVQSKVPEHAELHLPGNYSGDHLRGATIGHMIGSDT
jgi:tryptophanyl-tRNA synthetase